MELRRNALSSLASAMSRAEEGQLTNDNSNQEPGDISLVFETVSHGQEGDREGHRSKVDLEESRSRSSGDLTSSRPPAREPVRRRQHSQEGLY